MTRVLRRQAALEIVTIFLFAFSVNSGWNSFSGFMVIYFIRIEVLDVEFK